MQPWFGYHLPLYTYPGTSPAELLDRVVEQAGAANANGFGLLTVMDHLYQITGVGAEDEPMLEGWSVLNALARETTKVRLGTLVTGVTYRNPALLAKMATTLDITSGGRAILGLGAAWNESEHIGYGFDFPRVGERMDRLDEALTIAKLLFTEDRPSFEGKHYQLREALNVPKPVQPGGPPIMIGGGGEQRTLRIAAKHADMTHWFPLGMEMLRHKTEVLEGYCGEIGRDPSTIQRTMAAPVVVARDESALGSILELIPAERRGYVQGGTPRQAADALKPWINEGFTGFTFNNTFYKTTDQIAVIGELLNHRRVTVAGTRIIPIHVADLLAEGELMPVYVHLVEHPEGRVLVDTGMTELHALVADMDPRLWPLSEQDIDLAGIDLVANTHLHFDHCGGNGLFAGKPIHVQRRELEDARTQDDYTIPEWVDAPGVTYEPVDGELELLPGVRLVPAPGHTPGSQVVVVDAEAGERPTVIAGDSAITFGDLDAPQTEGQRVIRALDPAVVWLSHTHEPWRPGPGRS